MVTDRLNTEILLELMFCAENKESESEIVDTLLHTMLRKLNCFVIGIVKGDGETQLTDQQVFPFAFQKDENWEAVKKYILQADKNQARDYCELELNRKMYYVYCLSTYGFLIIGRNTAFGTVFKNELRSVVKFYAKLLLQSVANFNRRIVEEKLAEERRLLRTIIDNLPAHVFVKDHNHRRTLANRMEQQWFGLSSEQIVGKTDLDLFGSTLARELHEEDSLILEKGQSILGNVRKINDSWMLISKLPLRNEEGGVEGLVGIGVDFTERKQIEDQLLLFRKLFDKISDAIHVSTESGELFYVNKVAGERLGVHPDQVAHVRTIDYIGGIDTPELWSDHVAKIKANDFLLLEGVTLNRHTGESLPVEVTLKYVTVGGDGFIVAVSRDISERKKTEKALLESEEKYRFLAEHSSDVIWHLDPNYICDYISSSDVKLRGYQVDEVLGKSLWTILKPEGIERILELRSMRLQAEADGRQADTTHCEVEQLCKDGSWLWTEVSYSPHYDENGAVIGFHGSTRDISKRKMAELERTEMENRYRELVDNSPDGILIYKNGAIQFINHAGMNQLGVHDEDELKGYPIIRFIHPDYRQEMIQKLRVGFDDNLSISPIETVLKRADGTRMEVEVRAMQIVLHNELSVQLIVRDITSYKESERRLYASEQKYRRITENMSDVVWTSDLNFNFIYISPSVLKLTGFTPEEYMKKNLVENVTPESMLKIQNMLASAVNGYKGYQLSDWSGILSVEASCTRKDGSCFEAEIHMSLLRDENGRPVGIQGETRDISERKQAAVLLKQTRDNYESFFNTIDDFMFVLDGEGRIIHTNSTVRNRLGFTMDELNGMSVLDIHPENRREEAATIVQQMLSGDVSYCPVPILTKSGAQIPVETRITLGVWNGIPSIFGVTKDISRLQLSEEKFSKSFYLNPSACGFSDLLTGQYVEVNRAFHDLLGYSNADVVGKTAIELNIFSDNERKRLLSFADKNGAFFNVETELRARNGDIKHVLLSAEKIMVQDKKYRFTIVHDITALTAAQRTIGQYYDLQKVLINISAKYINVPLDQIEESIQHSLMELGTFVGADRAYIFEYDLDKACACNTFEWCAEGITAQKNNLQQIPLSSISYFVDKHLQGVEFCVENVYDLPDDGPDRVRAILEAQDVKSLIATPMICKEKLIGFVGFDSVKEFHAYTTQDKQLLEVFAQMLVNVSDRQRSDAMLRIQEEKYRNIISNMNLGIIEVDKSENIKFANQSFCELSGYSMDELIGMNTSSLLLSDKYADVLQTKLHLREKGISDSYEIEIRTKQGEVRWWFVSGAPNYNDQKELVGSIGIHLDITEQKILAKELEKAKITAEYAAKAKEIFLANMSHEIRTPLNVITGMVRELRKESMTLQQTNYVKHADTATEHLLTIVNNILDMSKIESGEFEINHNNFSLVALVADIRSILYSKVQDKDLEFEIHVPKDIAPCLIGDSVRLRQIMINLLGNAIKFTEKGCVSLQVELLEAQSASQKVRFVVEDTGIGISKDFMKRLFDKFSQEEGESTRRFEGTGLGMSITRELVQLMGGAICVESEKGQGTRISFELSFKIGDPTKLILKNNMLNENSFAGLKVLLVEDNEMNRFIAVQSLKHVGCIITEAVNGQEAVECMKTGNFDLILMDVQMPVMDGVEATKIIRSSYSPEVPVIALTANAFKQDIDLYLAVGMNDYLIKPYKENELYEKLSLYSFNRKKVDTMDQKPEVLFDLTELRTISRGDDSFVRKIVETFIQLSETTLVEMLSAVEQKNLVAVNRLSHKIKPSIDSLQISSLTDKIRLLERLTEADEEFSEFEKYVSETTSILRKVNEALQKL